MDELITVLIVDDHAVVRYGLRALLGAEGNVCRPFHRRTNSRQASNIAPL